MNWAFWTSVVLYVFFIGFSAANHGNMTTYKSNFWAALLINGAFIVLLWCAVHNGGAA